MATNLSQADRIRYARDAFKEFWTVARAEYPENMQMSFEEFYGYMSQRSQETLADFGLSVYLLGQNWGQSIDDAWEAMQTLARKNQGKVAQYDDGYPRMSDFYDALLGKYSEWSASRIGAAFGNVAKGTVEDIATYGGAAIGGYLGITAVVSIVGIFLVIMSYKKR